MNRRSFFSLGAVLPFFGLWPRRRERIAPAAKLPDSQLMNCVIRIRENDPGPLFTGTKYGVLANLDRYAIIPLAEYEDLLSRAGDDLAGSVARARNA